MQGGIPAGLQQRDKPAESATYCRVVFMELPPLSCRGLWGDHDSRMGNTKPPNIHPTGGRSQGWLNPKGTTPGMSPSPLYHLQAGACTPWGSALSLCNPQEAKQEHQPTCQGFPSHVFPSLGGKGTPEAHLPWSHRPGGDSSPSCSPGEEGENED